MINMAEEKIEELEDKDQTIENLKALLSYSQEQYRMQRAYIALLEAALKQYNIVLDIRDSGISTRVINKQSESRNDSKEEGSYDD